MKKKQSKTKKKANARTLNYNTLVKRNANDDTNNPNSPNNTLQLERINNKLNQNVSPEYKIIKYLGEGINGNLYLAMDANKNKLICKTVKLNSPNESLNNELKRQMNFELSILNFLSNNLTTRDYINPCLEHKIIDDEVITIFPVFNGYSLENLSTYLNKLDDSMHYKVAFHIIKAILYGMAKIHQSNIAHQNISEKSVLVSTFNSPGEARIKFTDFGLGCGYNSLSKNNVIDIDEYKNDDFFKVGNCKDNYNIPVAINENIMSKLSESSYLQIAQKYDVLCLGILFLKMLLFFANLDISLSEGYNSSNRETIKQITKKYLSSKDSLSKLKVNKDTKNLIREYLKLFDDYIFCESNMRENCQYILDKIIVFEKYRFDEF